MSCPVRQMRKQLRSSIRHLASERGVTLIELIVVMAILLVVIGALSDGFASVSRSEVDQTNRASDEQNARQALDRMRLDIHCASAVQAPQPVLDSFGATIGYRITFTETPADATQGCPGVTRDASAVQWCTNQVGAQRFQLFRSTVFCDAASADFQVDYVMLANIWPATACQVGRYPTVGVDMPVNRDPVKRPSRTYELKDEIALRNAPPPTAC
jgi:prepilin-type N-terminal cleavage/methylation domain-containing protein